jgi:murein endopeptidase
LHERHDLEQLIHGAEATFTCTSMLQVKLAASHVQVLEALVPPAFKSKLVADVRKQMTFRQLSQY